ncbi:MAG TPA: peptide deformylase, partial [Acidimicrobiales bacterium]|nr:peptide deformylase [Acidimicrobiales bacterium]
MTVRAVATLGHPVLRRRADPVPLAELGSPPVQQLIDDMVETMRYHRGAGLAAPQVMVEQRVAVIEVKENPRYPYKPDIPLTIL